MLPPVTWTNYLIAILLIVTAYYVFVGVRFWSHEIKSLLSSRFKISKELAPTKPHLPETFDPQTDPDQLELSFADTTDETFERVEELIGKIKAAIAQAADKGDDTEPLVHTLSLLLSGHADLKGSHFRPAVNELIQDECEKLGFPAPEEAEVERLWG